MSIIDVSTNNERQRRDRRLSGMSALVASILQLNGTRQVRDRAAATKERNLNAGRCGRCRKKPFDCRCNGKGEFKEELPSASLMLPPVDDTSKVA